MDRATVDFPHPDSPTMPRVSPSETSKLTDDTACTTCLRPAGNSTTKSSTRSSASAPSRS